MSADGAEPLSPGALQRRAISGSLWTAVHTLVSAPIAFAANAIIARQLGVFSYGQLAFLSATLALALQAANFGFGASVIQWGSAAEARGERRAAEGLLRRSVGFYMLVELPIVAAVGVALTRHQPWWVAAVLLIGVSGSCVFSGAALSVTIENRTAANAKLAILINLLNQSASVAAAVATGSAAAVWATRTAVAGVSAGLVLLLLDKDRRRAVLRPLVPRGLGRELWRFGLLTWVAGLVALLVFSRSEIFLLKAFDKHAALGVFALAYGLSQQLTAPADSMLHALLPAVTGMLSAWPERAAEAFDRALRVSTLVVGGITAVVVPPLVFLVPLIYGRGFGRAAWLLVPLALVSCFQSTNHPVTAFVNARRRAGLMLTANVVGLLLDVALAVALIPPFGAWGAAAANVAGQGAALLVLVWSEPLMQRGSRLGIAAGYRAFLVSLVVVAVTLPVAAAVRPWSAALAAAVACALGALLYLGLLRLVNAGLTAGDRDALAAAVSARARGHVARLLRPVTVSGA